MEGSDEWSPGDTAPLKGGTLSSNKTVIIAAIACTVALSITAVVLIAVFTVPPFHPTYPLPYNNSCSAQHSLDRQHHTCQLFRIWW